MARRTHGRSGTLVNISTYSDDPAYPIGSNEWNENPKTDGVLGFTKGTEAIASNALQIEHSLTEVTNAGDIRKLFGKTTENQALDGSNFYGNSSAKSIEEGDCVYLIKANGVGTVTLKHQYSGITEGRINTLNEGDTLLDENVPVILFCRNKDAGGNLEWFEYGGGVVADLGITTAKLAGDAVTGDKLADNAVDSEHYTDGSIDLAHMSANSIDSDQYVDGSIDNAHLADDAVGIAELSATGTASNSTFLRGDNAWTAVSSYSAPTIGSTSIGSGATVSTIAGLTLTSPVLNTGISGTALLDSDAMSGTSATTVSSSESIKAYVDAQVASNVTLKGDYNASTDSPSLDDGSPIAGILAGDHYVVSTAGDFFTETLQAGDSVIAKQDSPTTLAHWITVNNNVVTPIVGANIAANAIDSDHYTDASIDTAHIGNLQITTALIAADAIDGTKIADNAIDSEHYTDASIDNAHLADDAVGIAELSATGTANNTVFLRGDNTWASAGGGATATHDFTKQAYDFAPTDYTSSGTSTTRYLHVRPLKLSNGNEDTNNEGVFIRIKKNGTHNTEVQIA